MKKIWFIILVLSMLVIAVSLIVLIVTLEKHPQYIINSEENESSYVSSTNRTNYLEVNEVLSNYKKYVNKEIEIVGQVATRGGNSFKITDATGSTPPKYADSIKVVEYYATECTDYFTVGDTIIVSGMYTGTMYSLQDVRFTITADKISLFN